MIHMIPFLRQLRAKKRINRTIGLWYHPDYAPKCLSRTNRTLGVQVDRSEHIIDTLAKWNLVGVGDIRPSPLASLDDLELIHSRTYLESLSNPDVLGYVFGINCAEISIEELLRSQRRAVGGTVEAALAIARGELEIGFNLGGGFHHAEPTQGGGFCIYNDVAVAIAKLRQTGFKEPIAIIDLDYHQGNGNIVAFANDPSVMNYSIEGSVWSQLDAKNNVQVVLPPGTDDKTYLEALKRTLPEALKRHKPKLVFFIAGNDVLAEDSLGDFTLTQNGVAERDRFVVETVRHHVRTHGVKGLVITMSGGYSEKAWQSTASLAHWLLTDSIKLKRWPEANLRLEFGSIARSIRAGDLQKGAPEGDDFNITEADILGDLIHDKPAQRLLGFYTVEGIEFALDRYGILKKLEARGFSNIEVSADLADEAHQLVRLYAYSGNTAEKSRHLLAEVVARRRIVAPAASTGLPAKLEFLSIDWLLLQNPLKEFALGRPPLPGQNYPGLGMSGEALELFRQICKRLHLDGVISTPAHYHNAIVGMALGFHFLDPAHEGRLLAFKQILGRVTIPEAGALLAGQKLRLGDGTVVPWPAEGDQVLSVDRRLKAYFTSPGYASAVSKATRDWLGRGLQMKP